MGRYISNTSLYQDNELLLLKQGIAKNRKEFLTVGTDTWTIDHDVIARVRVWGGGGGGGGGYYNNDGTNIAQISGAGGGAGGAAEAILRLSAGTYNITIGDGGAAGKNSTQTTHNPTSGTAGGSSSFHTYITCSGGDGGFWGGSSVSITGGRGGDALFNWSGFDGLLYVDGRLGGAGGSDKPGYYTSRSASGGKLEFFRFGYGPEKGEGESGGSMGYASGGYDYRGSVNFQGGGGGGYNAPFIYGSNKKAVANSGRGVGTGGAGCSGYFTAIASPGNSGAVVIEWN